MNRTTDRTEIPAIDELQLIAAETTNLSKYATGFAAVVTVLGAVLGGIPALQSQTAESTRVVIVAGIFLVVAVGLIATAIVAAADLRARSQVTSTNLSLRAVPMPGLTWATPTMATSGASPQPAAPSLRPPNFIAPRMLMAVRKSGEDDYQLVIGVGGDTHGGAQYLVGRPGDRPLWITNDDVVDVRYEVQAIEAVIAG
jgi:hypothetical protein